MLIDNVKKLDNLKDTGRHKVNQTNLYLRVHANAKTFEYKHKKNQNTINWITIGKYKDEIEYLADAKSLANDIRKGLRTDYSVEQIKLALRHTKDTNKFQKKLEELASPHSNKITKRDEQTFKEMHINWYEFNVGNWSEKHAQRSFNTVKTYAYPYFGSKSISDVSTDDIRDCLNVLITDGKIPLFKKLRSSIENIFRYAITRKLLKENPTPAVDDDLLKPYSYREKNFGFMAIEKIPEFVEMLEKHNSTISYATLFILMTNTRPVEVCKMEWSEVDGNFWKVPAIRMKNKNPHTLNLCPYLMKVLEIMRGRTNSKYVFPYEDTHLANEAPNNLMGRLLRSRMQEFKHKNSDNNPVAHGLRHSFRTWAEQCGYRTEHLERQISHSEQNKLISTYMKYDYINERKVITEHWEDVCLGKVDPNEKARAV
jgi:integrase